MKEKETISIGRAAACELRLDHDSVSRRHAQALATQEGYIAIVDNGSSNGSWLNRNGQWIRIKRAVLGTRDRVRFGEQEVPLNRLVELFGAHGPVRLREGYSARGKPLVFDTRSGDNGRPRVVLENPRRNPLTGNIEENRQD